MVISQTIPTTPGITTALPKVDFSDCFATTNKLDNLETIAHLIFNNPPAWVKVLFAIRNSLAGLAGLKHRMPADYHIRYEAGGYIGFFKIFQIGEHELVMGLNDKHLNFRVSIFNSVQETLNIKVTTLVEYNNSMGKLYMSIIRPFHVMVVKSMVKKACKVIKD